MIEHAPNTITDIEYEDQPPVDGEQDDFDKWQAQLETGKSPEQVEREIRDHAKEIGLSEDEAQEAVDKFYDSAPGADPDQDPGTADDNETTPKDSLESMSDQLASIDGLLDKVDGQLEGVQESLAKLGEMMGEFGELLKVVMLFLNILIMYQEKIAETTDETEKKSLETDLEAFLARVPDISEDDIPKWAR